MASPQGIDYFNRTHPLAGYQARVSLRVRRRVYEWFRDRIGGVQGKAFLDHGSTPDTERADSNCFIKWLVTDGARVYATSPEDIRGLAGVFPGLVVLPWPPGGTAVEPVTAIIASAVIEHVGGHASQVEYLRELLAFRKPVLVTTPNRYHWLEFHTKLPLLHWLPRTAHRAVLRRLGLRTWAAETHLSLLSRADLVRAIQESSGRVPVQTETQWFRPWCLGMVSNLVALVTPIRGKP
jgi:hypothetical protein